MLHPCNSASGKLNLDQFSNIDLKVPGNRKIKILLLQIISLVPLDYLLTRITAICGKFQNMLVF